VVSSLSKVSERIQKKTAIYRDTARYVAFVRENRKIRFVGNAVERCAGIVEDQDTISIEQQISPNLTEAPNVWNT
jgi:hypothetical protein